MSVEMQGPVPKESRFTTESSSLMVIVLVFIWIAGVLAVVATVWSLKEQEALVELQLEAEQTASQLHAALDSFEDIASRVAGLRTVKTVLANPHPQGLETLNRFLEQTNRSLGSNKIFVLNHVGVVIGTSNYADVNSFQGYDFSFRPYFQQARLGESATYYAVGLVTRGRGYYYSAPVIVGEEVIGVAVVKILLEPVLEHLKFQQHGFLLVGYDSVVFGASDRDWEYRTLGVVPGPQREGIRKSQRYGDARLLPLAIPASEDGNLFSDDYINLDANGILQRYLVGRTLVREAGWHVFAVMPRVELLRRTLEFCVYYSLIYGVIVLLWLYWRKRAEMQRHVSSVNHELERRVANLTSELTSSNTELQRLVEHYQRTQSELEATQDQLVQTAKLAVLGELSAGINHELNQPLLALQTYAENSKKLMERGYNEMVSDNLDEILQITGSMHSIISRLKVFARKSPPEPRAVEVGEIVQASVGIMGPLLKKAGVELVVDSTHFSAEVMCEPVQVQQVLINLMTNASEAMQGMDSPRVEVRVQHDLNGLRIEVEDNGPGIAEDLRSRIFEPFFTTKSKGLGIGLALSRRIIETLSGTLTAEAAAEGGTRFVVRLRKYMR
ncbi:sensor histidine kinase [Oceanobacter kriegii]|uniref:sensor histidine kinase n=1 Tax=Oceanobacter kriegii TaxID=64972 RepID=UPI00146F537D|nr:ATP-binding protein [Oceanobacter kriegii]